jgi:rhamnose transport system substrate-binding protein
MRVAKRARVAALVALASLTLATTACAEEGTPAPGGSEAPATSIKAGLKIAFLPKQVNNAYFDTSDNKGGKVAVEEFGGQYSQTGPSEGGASAQVSYINTLSQQQTDAIVVSANDKDAICGALNEARQAGAKVVTYDSDTNPSCRDLFINQATAEGIAKVQIKLIADAVGPDGGDIAILSATANATNQNAWIEMMKTELQKPEYSNLELVDVVYGDDKDDKSFAEAQGLLAKHPNLKGIISPTTVGIAAAGQVPVRLRVQGQGAAHRSGHAEPDARLRQGRHGQGVRAVEPGRPRLPGGVRGRQPRLRHDHRQGGRQVQGRQAR